MSDEQPLPNTVFDEGAASYTQGLPREDCPYPPDADERAPWLDGWDHTARRDGIDSAA